MFRSYSFNVILLSTIGVLALTSCRKKLNFEASQSTSSGLLDPKKPTPSPWDIVNLQGISNLENIESDGNFLYFDGTSNGVRNIYKMDLSGNITLLGVVANNATVSCLRLIDSDIYYCIRALTPSAVHAINSNGSQTAYPFLLSQSVTEIKSLVDLDTSILIVGNFGNQPGFSSNSKYVYFLNKTTGLLSHIPGIQAPVEDATVIQNFVYVSGRGLKEVTGSGAGEEGYAVCLLYNNYWTPKGANDSEANNNQSNNLPYVTGLKSYNGSIYVAGSTIYSSSGIATLGSNKFINEAGFYMTSSNWKFTKAKLKVYENHLYAFGEVRFLGAIYNSVYERDGNSWRSLGKVDEIPDDIAVLSGYIYGAINGEMRRFKF